MVQEVNARVDNAIRRPDPGPQQDEEPSVTPAAPNVPVTPTTPPASDGNLPHPVTTTVDDGSRYGVPSPSGTEADRSKAPLNKYSTPLQPAPNTPLSAHGNTTPPVDTKRPGPMHSRAAPATVQNGSEPARPMDSATDNHSTPLKRPSAYLHQRCPLCFGGELPQLKHSMYVSIAVEAFTLFSNAIITQRPFSSLLGCKLLTEMQGFNICRSSALSSEILLSFA